MRLQRVVPLAVGLGLLLLWLLLGGTDAPQRSARSESRQPELDRGPSPRAVGSPAGVPDVEREREGESPELLQLWGERRRIRPRHSATLRLASPAGRYAVQPTDEAQGDWLDGKRHGTWRARWPTGGLRVESTWERGRLHGPITTWYPDGRVELQGSYVDGRRDGAWYWWFSDGARAAIEEYRAGRFDGEVVHWHPDGSVAARGRFVGGLPDGVQRFHEPGGPLREEQHWALGVPCDTWLRYDDAGTLERRVPMPEDRGRGR